ncbi:hypothetical protein AB0N38_11680 [Micromonospora aurantiaca]|uniref:Uncharacterized protein n=1 Tax=Micromonospora aurantiaca (nom. illeg.) TaxID=47850 RepID=A0A6N3JVI5_9ACTN|nr:hypothetical protein [Micromonospora aurantiaca]AXH89382.1 hypothetical protein DVH21_05215 [Micromonospora aurantiaca]
MGLFSKKTPEPSNREYRGGCSSHDMHGPARKTMKEADKDVWAHNKRMHGGKSVGGYVERRK